MKKYNIDPFMEKVLSDEYYKLRSSRNFILEHLLRCPHEILIYDISMMKISLILYHMKGAYCILNPSLYQLNANKESTSITQKTATV